jgi:stage II sporulation protein D
MRPLAVLVAWLVLAAAAGTGAAQPEPARVGASAFVLTGGGWGHGVGMSQWGAYGQALAGRTHQQILQWYYAGTELGEAPVKRVRVGLVESAKQVTISSPVAFHVRDATGVDVEVPPGTLKLGPGLKPRVDGKPVPLQGPLRFLPGAGAPLSLGGVGYRGELEVSVVEKKLLVINVVGLEAYLRGVVPREMPKHWPLEALKAQAVAARSYALARRVKGKPFDHYADWRSQVYGGIPAEAPRASEAVQATARQALLYQGKVATTFFFSSSGGRTATGAEVFGVDVPYLVSVDDQWDERSPHHVWPPRMLTGAAIKTAYQLGSLPVDVVVELTASKRPGRIVLVTATGAEVETNGIDARARLGLLSPNFRLGVLRLERPAAAAAPGTAVRLTGVARDVLAPTVEELRAGAWVPVARPRPRADGTFAATVRPAAVTRYRLTGSGLAGPVLAVRVVEGGA